MPGLRNSTSPFALQRKLSAGQAVPQSRIGLQVHTHFRSSCPSPFSPLAHEEPALWGHLFYLVAVVWNL